MRIGPGVPDMNSLFTAAVAGLSAALARLKDDACANEMGTAAYRRYWADPLTTVRHVERTVESYRHLLG